MNGLPHDEDQRSTGYTWAIITGIAGVFLLWGFLIFFVIGDKGPPVWDFSVIPDIPGESFYSTYSPTRPHGMAPGNIPMPSYPQHVMGPPTENQRLELSPK